MCGSLPIDAQQRRRGPYSRFEDAIYTLKRDTRHFAKRQITWFKREKEVTWIDKSELEYNEDLIIDKILEELKLNRIFI